ncbi:MAG: site-2 protease family protein [Candidatus Schekmanbacteria bacterium]|nr:site-2 protease family protein [Candidatus Schekmanbacteria bacterium]
MASCPGCGTELAPRLLSCPACQRLVHGQALQELADRAGREQAKGDLAAELALWREALELLPSESGQARRIAERVVTISDLIDKHPAAAGPVPQPQAHRDRWKPGAGGGAARIGIASLGAGALVLWKLKAVLVLALSKGKLLLMGLTKMSTLSTMLLSVGVYWAAWGWAFALGLVGSIYVHEMGHVAALRRFGIRASAPTFIPGLGAFIRARQRLATPAEEARVGLAGPLWGLGAAAAAYAAFLATDAAMWAAIAQVGAWINLFNLLPIRPLDGGRGFCALSRGQRLIAAAILGGMWYATGEGLLVLLGIVAIVRALGRGPAAAGAAAEDRLALVQYAVLAVTLSLLATVDVPVVAP